MSAVVVRPRQGLFPVVTRHAPGRELCSVGDLSVLVMRVHEGRSRVYGRDDLDVLGVDVARVYLRSRENLELLVDAHLVRLELTRGPRGVPMVRIKHPALGASCLLLPGLRDRMLKLLGGESLCAVVVRRDLMVVFSADDPLARVDVGAKLAEWAAPHRPLTRTQYGIEESGPRVLAHADTEIPVDVDEDEDPTIYLAPRERPSGARLIGDAISDILVPHRQPA